MVRIPWYGVSKHLWLIHFQVVEMLVSVSETTAEHIEPYSDTDFDSSISVSPDYCEIQDESVEELGTDIEYVVSNITHIITCLYKLSMLIQNPAPRDRLHKSQAIPVAHFLPYEKKHIQDKFPNAPAFLVDRLARANVMRRQLLKYYQRHQRKIVGYGQPAGPGFSSNQRLVIENQTPSATGNSKSPALEIPEPLATRVDRKTEGTMSTVLNSQTTISAYIAGPQELASDPLSLVEAESEGGSSRTSFTSSSGSMGGLYVPRPPSLLNEAPFQCPYCFLIIRPKNTDSWL